MAGNCSFHAVWTLKTSCRNLSS